MSSDAAWFSAPSWVGGSVYGTDDISISAGSQSPDAAALGPLLGSPSGAGTQPQMLPETPDMPETNMVAIPLEADRAASLGTAGQDFDRDGQADIFWRNAQTGEAALRLMEQGGTIRDDIALQPLIRDPRWQVRGSGDFNSDGFADLVWHHSATGQVLIWLLNGGQPLSAVPLPPETDRAWQIQGVGNFDDDFLADDLLWFNPSTGQRRVWLMDNAVRAEVIAIEPQVGAPGELLGLGDFDNNGTSDLLWREPSDRLTLWQMDGSQRIRAVTLTDPPSPPNAADPLRRGPDWSLVAIGDYSNPSGAEQGDGHVDIIWKNAEGHIFWSLEDTAVRAETFIAGDFLATGQFNIEIDYRFDSTGWFTGNTAQARQRKAALEAAAEVWEKVLQDEFEDIPTGTRTPFVRNPETDAFITTPGEEPNIFVTDRPIDDLLIFVGTQSLGPNGSLGRAGSSGYFSNESRYIGDDFEPWIGQITVNRDANWYFGLTPPDVNDPIQRRQSDFLSTAVHEIGHILGFSRSVAAFENQVESSGAGDRFIGPNALAITGDLGIPLDGSHIQDGFELSGSGEVVMDPQSFTGQRQLPTLVDLAIFDDLGYVVNYSRAARNPPNV